MSTVITPRIGPADHGRRMSLAEFDPIEVEPGYQYELSRGVITVSDVPGIRHFLVSQVLLNALYVHKFRFPDQIYAIAGGSDCKLLIPPFNSKRHPDISVYVVAPPATDIWSLWMPGLVIEVVSPSSQERDYELKPEEYHQFGVREYWIVDPNTRKVTVLQRQSDLWAERVLQAPEHLQTELLPGLDVALEALWAVLPATP